MFWQKFKAWLSIGLEQINFCGVRPIKYILMLICVLIVWEESKEWLPIRLDQINFCRVSPMKYILMFWQKFKEWLSINLDHLGQINFRRVRSIALLNELPIPNIRKKKKIDSSLVVLGSTMTNEELQHPLITLLSFDSESLRYQFESVKISQLPIEILRSLTASFKCKAVHTKEIISSLPLVFIPSLQLREEKFYFEFMDENQDHFGAIQGKKDCLSAENCVNDDSQFFWSKHEYDSSSFPRVAPEVIYVKEEECFVVLGGFVPTKFLPNECINGFCIDILTKRPYLSTKKIIEKSYFPIRDLWKFHIKESRWELIARPRYLIKHDTGRWQFLHPKPFGRVCYSFHCPSQKKIFFATPVEESSELWEYDYLRNSFRLIADIDLEEDHYSNGTRPLVDDSNNTVIFLADLLQKLLVVCLKTFKCIEIPLEPVVKPKDLLSGWNMILTETGKRLVLIGKPDEKSAHKGETVRFTFICGFIDWEKIKKNKITPFLKKHRNAAN